MKQALIEKFQQGRPMAFSAEEADHLREALRAAVAVTLSADKAAVADDARVFDDLGMDSIDVFDVLDQLAEEFEVQVALEELPDGLVHGGEGATFDDFAEGILDYFRSQPATPQNNPQAASE